VNDILTLLIQQEFPKAQTRNDVLKMSANLSKEKRLEKLNYVISECGKNYKLSKIVKQKLSFLFDFEKFVEEVNSRKKNKKNGKENVQENVQVSGQETVKVNGQINGQVNGQVNVQVYNQINGKNEKKRKRSLISEVSTFPLFVRKNNQLIETLYMVQFRDNDIYSVGVFDKECDITLPLPYKAVYINETTFYLKEDKLLIKKKKNNCINHTINIDSFLEMASTVDETSKPQNDVVMTQQEQEQELKQEMEQETSSKDYIVNIEITKDNNLKFLLNLCW